MSRGEGGDGEAEGFGGAGHDAVGGGQEVGAGVECDGQMQRVERAQRVAAQPLDQIQRSLRMGVAQRVDEQKTARNVGRQRNSTMVKRLMAARFC